MQFIIKFAVHVRSLSALHHKRWHLTVASKNCIRMVNFQDEAERRNRSIVWMRFGGMLFVNRMLINSLASKNQVVSSWNRRTINWGWKTCWWIWFADSMKVWKFKSGKKIIFNLQNNPNRLNSRGAHFISPKNKTNNTKRLKQIKSNVWRLVHCKCVTSQWNNCD